MLTLSLFKSPDLKTLVAWQQAANPRVVCAGSATSSPTRRPTTPAFGGGGRGSSAARTPEQQNLLQQGGQIFAELCGTCHGDDARGKPLAGAAPGITMAPPLAGSPRVNGHRDYVIKALLGGLTGPIGDKTYTEVMVPMAANKDEWIAAAASYVRSNFGNNGGIVSPADVARVRASVGTRKAPFTVAEIEGSLPKAVDQRH